MIDLSVRFKILTLVILFSVLVIALNINSAFSSRNATNELKVLSSQTLNLMQNLEKSRQLLLQQSVEFEKGYFQLSIAKSLSGYGTEQIVKSSEEFKKYTEELKLSIITVTELLSTMPKVDGLEELLAEIETLKTNQQSFLEASDTTYNWWIKLKTFQANKSRKLAKASLDEVGKNMGTIIELIEIYVNNANIQQTEKLNQNLIATTIIAIAAIVAGVAFSLMIISNITRPLRKVVQRAEAIAQGDLTHSTKSAAKNSRVKRNEILKLELTMDKLVIQLSNIINDVTHSSQKLTQAANNLSSETKSSSQMVDDQQRETSQISQSIEEIRSTAIHVSQSTADASTAAQEAEQATQEGHDIVRNTIGSIESLANQINVASDTIYQLETHTADISQILNVILGIAEQTNLLALNAAIEAARAGEQGRGFAVVADEVRTLAQNTQNATQEIEKMISTLQDGTNSAVKVMKSSHTISKDVVEAVKEEENSLQHINSSVAKIRDMNDRISATAEEQSSVTSEVNNNVINITEIAKKTTHSIHTIDDNATTVAELANQLSDKIAYFKMQ
ncbi:methyl-accepting chemotaxis protein [Marinomonas agarivorans]|nr:methyl-accepting chemotaxis protein [Marinomonas agarivorans]